MNVTEEVKKQSHPVLQLILALSSNLLIALGLVLSWYYELDLIYQGVLGFAFAFAAACLLYANYHLIMFVTDVEGAKAMSLPQLWMNNYGYTMYFFGYVVIALNFKDPMTIYLTAINAFTYGHHLVVFHRVMSTKAWRIQLIFGVPTVVSVALSSMYMFWPDVMIYIILLSASLSFVPGSFQFIYMYATLTAKPRGFVIKHWVLIWICMTLYCTVGIVTFALNTNDGTLTAFDRIFFSLGLVQVLIVGAVVATALRVRAMDYSEPFPTGNAVDSNAPLNTDGFVRVRVFDDSHYDAMKPVEVPVDVHLEPAKPSESGSVAQEESTIENWSEYINAK